jgi:hypothetical protein
MAEEIRRAGNAFFLDICKYFPDEFGDQGIGAGLPCPKHIHGRTSTRTISIIADITQFPDGE